MTLNAKKVGQASRLPSERVSASIAPASPTRAGETPALLWRSAPPLSCGLCGWKLFTRPVRSKAVSALLPPATALQDLAEVCITLHPSRLTI